MKARLTIGVLGLTIERRSCIWVGCSRKKSVDQPHRPKDTFEKSQMHHRRVYLPRTLLPKWRSCLSHQALASTIQQHTPAPSGIVCSTKCLALRGIEVSVGVTIRKNLGEFGIWLVCCPIAPYNEIYISTHGLGTRLGFRRGSYNVRDYLGVCGA